MSKLRNQWKKRGAKKRHESGDDLCLSDGKDGDDRKEGKSSKSSRKDKLNRSASAASPEIVLHHAVTQQNLTTTKQILDTVENIEVDFVRPPGVTPLHIACVLGNLKLVSMLTDKGANIKMTTGVGLTPLRLSCIFGHYDVAEYLISIGSDPSDVKDGFEFDSDECRAPFSRNAEGRKSF